MRAQEEAGLEPVTDGGLLATTTPSRLARDLAPDRPGRQAGRHRARTPRRPGRTVGGSSRSAASSATSPTPAARSSRSTSRRRPGSAPTRSAVRASATPSSAARRRDRHASCRSRSPAAMPTPPGSRPSSPRPTTASPSTSSQDPDNWRLVVATPGDRGIVCGALPADADHDEGPETLLWAAGYAASTKGRGPARVGLATASSFAHLPWDVAVARDDTPGEAVRIAALPPEERRAALDPRAVDSRSAALGRYEPDRSRPSRPPRRGDGSDLIPVRVGATIGGPLYHHCTPVGGAVGGLQDTATRHPGSTAPTRAAGGSCP